MATIPALPAKFKPVQHYIKIASDHIKRDPVIAYYSYFYAVQKALEIDKKSPECRTWLNAMMDVLEKLKTEYKETNEAFQNEVVGHAYVEDYTLKLFFNADNKDRMAQFDKVLVKLFYSSGLLFDVLQQFGDLSEELKTHQKYAKWKASYIHRCLQSGETPVPGPMPLEGAEDSEFGEADFGGGSNAGASSAARPPNFSNVPPQQPYAPPAQAQYPNSNYGNNTAASGYPAASNAASFPPARPGSSTLPAAAAAAPYTTPSFPDARAAQGNVNLRTEDYQRAMKLCKFAQSALQYEDSTAAIDNLSKALRLLSTGKE